MFKITRTIKVFLVVVVGMMGAIGSHAAVLFDMLDVHDDGNPADPLTGRGITGPFRMATRPVSNAQYVEFLNAVDPMGLNTLGLYNTAMGSDARGGISFDALAVDGAKYNERFNMNNKPVNFVSAHDAMRFINWMNNGQAAGDTETGAYTMTPTGIANNTISRNHIAGFVLPTSEESYKSVFYDPRTEAQGGPTGNDFYWMYPNQSDSLPVASTVDANGFVVNGPGTVNFNNGADWNGQDGHVSEIGSDGGLTYYGLLDAGGNVWEWNDTIALSLFRGLSGGSHASTDPTRISSQGQFYTLPELESAIFGFRVGYRYAVEQIPEPSTLAYLVVIGFVMQLRRRVMREHKAGVTQS